MQETWFNPEVGKISWRRKWQPTPVPLPGKSDGRRSLVGYSPWGCKESDTTERLYFRGLNQIILVKCLEQYLAQRRSLVDVYCCYIFEILTNL